ncbi:MAG: molybdopterin oxidoreductase [Chlorobiaceae bacterium]|nr:molybdopterin oxidoreductase [Chlorobiaceae bacterium]MBA4308993.1 molybdopterin oxidoreductase [Chlorobiaceae bacterium]
MADNKDQNLDVNYWRSFEELNGDVKSLKLKHDEFHEGVTEDFDPEKNLSGISRRKFLALVGASAALAGAGCSDYREKGEIVAYNKKPEEIVIGKANYYSSTCSSCSLACGILIKTREGRPIKIDGNPDHPINKGKICAKGQASILNLYDPSRYQRPTKGNFGFRNDIDWKTVDKEIKNILTTNDGKEIAIVLHKVNSPTAIKVLEEFKNKYPTLKFYYYDLFDDGAKLSAFRKTHGVAALPVIKFEDAKIILALEGDFLGVDGNKLEQGRKFAERRDVDDTKNFSRVYSVEGNLSITGMNSDYRLRLSPVHQYEFVASLLNELILKRNIGGIALDGVAREVVSSVSLDSFASKHDLDKNVLKSLADDLANHRSDVLVFAGSILNEETHILVNLLNEVLGNSKLFSTTEINENLHEYSSKTEIENLVQSMKNGNVKLLIHFDSNPVYHLSKDFDYENALKNVANTVTLCIEENETAALSNYVLPINHNFESWGDASVRNGLFSLLQPVISPLYDTRQKEAILLHWMNDNVDNFDDKQYLNFLKNNWMTNVYPKINSPLTFDRYWNISLHDGVSQAKNKSQINYQFNRAALNSINKPKVSGNYCLTLTENLNIADGRFANNGWLQELPHPISKVTWDNYAAISHQTGKKINLKINDLVEISVHGKTKIFPVVLQPGLANNFINIELGFGRTHCPVIAADVGVNANHLLSKENFGSSNLYDNVTIKKVDGKGTVVTTQEHHNYDEALIQEAHKKRFIIIEGTVNQYLKDPKFVQTRPRHTLKNINKEHEYKDVKWAMSIDLNKCIGCGDCVVGCNVENNIPIVGKDQVGRGREMQWLRIDRYYSGTPENPKINVQPMLCQHCDQAPCENVCPVVATTHSPDGLNQMIYNRCVGTRYCSNNCPYKVRRFNFFNFRDNLKNSYYEQDSISLLHNPEVTVRSRGVMEKCTFCIQRIMDAREEVTRSGIKLKGTDVKTACQEACNTNAIKFGDMNDLESEINRYRNHDLGYVVLEDTNVRPNVTYIAKLRNSHSEEM